MELLPFDTTDDRPDARDALDEGMQAGLAHAARGDWLQAAPAFQAALGPAERAYAESGAADAQVRLAVALTNLGQARAHVGDLDHASALLARSAELRERLADEGVVGARVATRGLVDLAAVQAACGEGAAARATLLHARAVLAAVDAALSAVITDALALLEQGQADAFTSAQAAEQGNADAEAPATAGSLPWLDLDDDPLYPAA